jgi:hypothetical protein
VAEIEIHCKYDELADPKLLKPYKKNRNKHPQTQIDRLAESFEYHGIRKAIIVDKERKVIAAGHGRRLAAIKAEIKKYPVEYQSFKTEEDLYTFCQADNAATLESELDFASINQDIVDLGPFEIKKMLIPNFKIDFFEKKTDEELSRNKIKSVKICPHCKEVIDG